MLRHNEAAALSAALRGPWLAPLLEGNIWRLYNNFYGTITAPADPRSTALFLGAEGGMEVLRLRKTMPDVDILVVEPNEQLSAELAACLKNTVEPGHIMFAPSLAALQPHLAGRHLGFIRVGKAYFNWDELVELLRAHGAGHICGEFDPVDAEPVEVVRLCRRHAESFFWRVHGFETPLNGRGRGDEYEVSVVVPCYKVLPWVDRCMETLAAQTIESIEIIAVDDGSPDATGERLDEWAARFPGRIRVIHKPNGGCASARNAGLLAARGTYVAFVDGDDWVEPPMFEALYRSAVQYGSDIAQCGYTEVYEDSGRTERFPTAWEAGQSAGALGLVTSPHKFLGLKPTIWRRIYRRDFLLGNGISFPEHVRRFDDLPFQFEALARAQRMSVIPDCYYNYRLERAGQDVAAKGAKLFVHFPIFDWLQEHVGAWADVKIERALFECKLNTHLWALPRIGKELEGTYTSLVAHDIFGRRTYMSLLEMFRVALRQGPGAALFLLRCFGRARLAPPAMVPSD